MPRKSFCQLKKGQLKTVWGQTKNFSGAKGGKKSEASSFSKSLVLSLAAVSLSCSSTRRTCSSVLSSLIVSFQELFIRVLIVSTLLLLHPMWSPLLPPKMGKCWGKCLSFWVSALVLLTGFCSGRLLPLDSAVVWCLFLPYACTVFPLQCREGKRKN